MLHACHVADLVIFACLLQMKGRLEEQREAAGEGATPVLDLGSIWDHLPGY
jgi:hypothetical protein